jgi:hypothetical protein
MIPAYLDGLRHNVAIEDLARVGIDLEREHHLVRIANFRHFYSFY